MLAIITKSVELFICYCCRCCFSFILCLSLSFFTSCLNVYLKMCTSDTEKGSHTHTNILFILIVVESVGIFFPLFIFGMPFIWFWCCSVSDDCRYSRQWMYSTNICIFVWHMTMQNRLSILGNCVCVWAIQQQSFNRPNQKKHAHFFRQPFHFIRFFSRNSFSIRCLSFSHSLSCFLCIEQCRPVHHHHQPTRAAQFSQSLVESVIGQFSKCVWQMRPFLFQFIFSTSRLRFEWEWRTFGPRSFQMFSVSFFHFPSPLLV